MADGSTILVTAVSAGGSALGGVAVLGGIIGWFVRRWVKARDDYEEATTKSLAETSQQVAITTTQVNYLTGEIRRVEDGLTHLKGHVQFKDVCDERHKFNGLGPRGPAPGGG